MQQAMAGDVVDAVERIMGRRVRARTAGVDFDAGVANELFHLAPATR